MVDVKQFLLWMRRAFYLFLRGTVNLCNLNVDLNVKLVPRMTVRMTRQPIIVVLK